MGDIAYHPPLTELTRLDKVEHEDEENNDGSGRAKRAATSVRDRLWHGGVVYYSFSSQFNGTCNHFDFVHEYIVYFLECLSRSGVFPPRRYYP